MNKESKNFSFHDLEPEKEIFLKEVYKGLSKDQKTLSCKYFYDDVGSRLFSAICKTKEYYPTRTELKIMRMYSHEMAALVKPECLLIEYGSGNGEKIRLLLNDLKDLSGYVPIDISKEILKQTSEDLNKDYPHLEVLAVCADFTKEFHIPKPKKTVNQRVVYFPGSTIGNFDQESAVKLLSNMNHFLEAEDGLLLGIDLKKDKDILSKAYNDSSGYTEAFNRNVLLRINRELGGHFRLDWFEHKAYYNAEKGRVEMHLVSRRDHDVVIQDELIHFKEGESIHTESSHKYAVEEFAELAKLAGFDLKKYWVDENHLFGVLYLTLSK